MTREQTWRLICLAPVMALLAGIAISCGTVDQRVASRAPHIEGATFTGNKSCADCHTNIVRGFTASAHARFHGAAAEAAGFSGCESCHGAGSRHIAAGGGRGKFIVNPGKDPAACFSCHLDIKAQTTLPYHHPIAEGKMNCVQCHDPHGRDIMKPARGLAMARLNQNCTECHRDESRTHVFEHEALREGCVACHQVHGSINPKMLVQRDANLCLKCHAQIRGTGFAARFLYIGRVPHDAFLSQGTCWSAGCHTAIHGSNVSKQLRY